LAPDGTSDDSQRMSDGQPFQACHLFLASLRITSDALLKLVCDSGSLRASAGSATTSSTGTRTNTLAMALGRWPDGERQPSPAEAGLFSVDSNRNAVGDARQNGTAGDGSAPVTVEAF